MTLPRPPILRGPLKLQAIRRFHASHRNRQIVEQLEERGFVAAITSPKIHDLVSSRTTVYAGVDPSASSLHVGNLLPLLALLHFRNAGHRVLALIGGATGSIGDPSGRSTERPSLSPDQLEHNVEGITTQVKRFFDRGTEYMSRRKGKGKETEEQAERGEVVVLNNLDWFKEISFLDFLRTTGKMSRVGTMIARDSVKTRLNSDQGISFTEFSYQLLQAHDFAHLYRTQGCKIQLGGSDQWGNIVSGIDLIRRQQTPTLTSSSASETTPPADESAFGLTIPLLTTSTGEKFGKSAGNAVWLDESRTSISDFYQFFLRSTDQDVELYLRLLTGLPLEHISSIIRQHRAEPEARTAQRALADEVTELVHGPEGVEKARVIAAVLFSTSLASLSSSAVRKAFADDPRLVGVSLEQAIGVPLTKLVATFGRDVKSRSEANRIVASGGFYLNNERITDPKRTLLESDLIDSHLAIVRTGKTSHLILHVD
ncbi:tyrosyl-tRNA synthetase, partial [Tremellales sp. Uapishka_1]